jgi:hypothetical protein
MFMAALVDALILFGLVFRSLNDIRSLPPDPVQREREG